MRWAALDPASGELTADDVAEVVTDRDDVDRLLGVLRAFLSVR